MSNLTPKALARATTYLMQFDREMPVSRLFIFLMVAQKDGVALAELSRVSGISRPAVSRIVGLLGDNPQRGAKDGLGWVNTVPDPEDPRRGLVYITPKGRKVLADIENLSD